MTEAEKEFERLQRIADEHDLKNRARVESALQRLEASKSRWYVARIVLRNVEGNAGEASDYGDFYFRRWNAMEVLDIKTHPAFIKNEQSLLAISLKSVPPLLGKEDQLAIYQMKCRMIEKASHPSSGITAEKIMEVGNYAWVEHVFAIIAERSGLGNSLSMDFDAYFRDGTRVRMGMDSVREDASLPLGSKRTALG